MENWKPIEGFEDAYEVSDHGRVRSLERRIWCKRGEGYYRTISPRFLRPILGGRGYPHVSLHKDGKQWGFAVHASVATAFHGPRPKGYDCMHLDNDMQNNFAENLRWGTRSENLQQMWDEGRH